MAVAVLQRSCYSGFDVRGARRQDWGRGVGVVGGRHAWQRQEKVSADVAAGK